MGKKSRGRPHQKLVEQLGDVSSRRSPHPILRRAWSPQTPFRYLNSVNRLVRTRMARGQAARCQVVWQGPPGTTRSPYADLEAVHSS